MTEETVFVAQGSTNSNVYHLKKDCGSTDFGELREVKKSRFSNRRVCKPCERGHEPPEYDERNTHNDCPFCGESVVHFAKHIPECDQNESLD
jgi:hypothetical protein